MAENASNEQLREAAEFASNVLAELYAKYSIKIGPFASQAQKANVRLHAALKRPPAETQPAPASKSVTLTDEQIRRYDADTRIELIAMCERLTSERDEAREAYTDENLQKHGIIGKYGRLRAVLTELLACKALREKIDGELSACHQEMSPQLRELENEYQLRKPLAWRDASAALSGEPPAKLQPDETESQPTELRLCECGADYQPCGSFYGCFCQRCWLYISKEASGYGKPVPYARPAQKASERKLTDAENEAMDRDIMRAIRGSEKAKCEHGQEIGSYCGECPSDIAE